MAQSTGNSASLRDVTLDDKYVAETGSVFLSGTQALVRMAIMQRLADERAGLNTAGYITGYRGSPVGNVDQTFHRAGKLTGPNNISLHEAVNEDLAATAVWGTQQTGLFGPGNVDGVFSMWYGKGPGVHRTGDVFLHANLAGTSPHGGVLAIGGDDHVCKSSTNTHQSEFSFVDAMIPVLNPAGLQDMLDLAPHGWAMSRYSGCWSAMKVTSETLDSSGSVNADISRNKIILPDDFEMPADGLGIRWPDKAVDQERRLHQLKLPAAMAYARANNINSPIFESPKRRIGIVSTGKSYLDTLQAFEMLGLSEDKLSDMGFSLFKVAMVWPLEPEGIKAFCQDHDLILVIEEKRGLLEGQTKEILYNLPSKRRPEIFGKTSKNGLLRLPAYGELAPLDIARFLGAHDKEIGKRVEKLGHDASADTASAPVASRTPYFCSGCPHSSSTKVPEGSKAFAGIGCHYMTIWMDRSTEGFTHMGGEGANWIGLSEYSDTDHMFQNMGDGTYFHSGYLAIRAAVAADVNVTYKILFNDAVAMTGGQSMDGELTPLSIALQMRAEGVEHIALVAEDISKYSNPDGFPKGTTFHPRDEMDAVQRRLREVKGVSVLIFDQMCAAEKRRHRKRKRLPEPQENVVINDLVCEGCGDCSKASNCLSVVPKETEFGVKRAIDLSSCNKDYSCINGFCPSFVSVSGGSIKKAAATDNQPVDIDAGYLPEPDVVSASSNILVTGVGGTGVVTIGALIAMAAHLEGKGCSTLDMTGMAQKGGPVTSHIKVTEQVTDVKAVRISPESADVIIGCDLVVSAGNEALSLIRTDATKVILNDAPVSTSQFVLDRNYDLPTVRLKKSIEAKAGKSNVSQIDASAMMTRLLGNSIGTNLFLVGIAYQKGLLPVSAAALSQAIELNGVSIDMNNRAFNLGRLYALDPKAECFAQPAEQKEKHISQSLDELVERRSAYLVEYQNDAYAQRYLELMEQVIAADKACHGKTGELSEQVARNAFKLMAYKDEYEVARLMTSKSFSDQLKGQFEGKVKLSYYLAPPLFAPKDKSTGLPRKIRLGGWVAPLFKIMARFKSLRGGRFDIFGYTGERKMERQLRDDYGALILNCLPDVTISNYRNVVELAKIPDQIRGFGHVKAESVAKAKVKQSELLAALDPQKSNADRASKNPQMADAS